jgi:glycosyltransferase involved in cell wall biosynthesis
MKIPLSVFIITKNEADRISGVINAVKKIADEILVIDSGSEDDTCEVAAKAGAKVIFNKWQGYGLQKIFGENQCRNKWILNVDADEEVSPELCDEIEKIFLQKTHENFSGFRVKIVNKFRFEKKPKKFAYFYNQFRLYNKDFAGFNNSSVHDSVELKKIPKQVRDDVVGVAPRDRHPELVSESDRHPELVSESDRHPELVSESDRHPELVSGSLKIGQLKNIIYHQSFRSFSHWIEKINSYSQMQAEDSFRKGKCPSILKVFLTPTFAFLKAYFLRRYFIYGFDGLVYSYIFSFSRFAKVIKTREIFKAQNEK